MILTRFVRIQLIIFTIASVIGIAVMLFGYIQVQTLLGIGKLEVKLELADSGGLYRFSNVTYRGVQVGKVTNLDIRRGGAVATMRLNTSPRIPADVRAEVHSVSAVGEQYVDLLPRGGGPPWLQDGSVIARNDTTVPPAAGPMLDQLSALAGSVPADRVSLLLDETFKGLNGARADLGSLMDSASTIASATRESSGNTRALLEDSQPLLDSQVRSADSIRTWARSLAGVTAQVADNDPQIRTLLNTGPGSLQEVSRLLAYLKPTLPVLLANLTSVGQVAVTYHPSLETLLVLLPPLIAVEQSIGGPNNPDGLTPADFRLQTADPVPCTVGFLPPSAWRSPDDTSTVDTPEGVYCKLPQDSPIAVRGARNLPCMGVPGKRAPTVEMCYSEQEYQPLADRGHATGPYPFDPNLIAQGVPPDGRADPGLVIPPDAETPPQPPAPEPPPPPGPASPGPENGTATPEIPGQSATVPGFGVTHYDPSSGKYFGPDGRLYQQADVVSGAGHTWQNLVLPASVG